MNLEQALRLAARQSRRFRQPFFVSEWQGDWTVQAYRAETSHHVVRVEDMPGPVPVNARAYEARAA